MPQNPDFKQKVDEFAGQTQRAIDKAVGRAGSLAHDKRKEIEDFLDKTGERIDARTEGKYTEKVEKTKRTLVAGVDRLAERRPGPEQ